jgi:glycosyltransferase involved in cell wall biosynthesis
MNQCPSTPQPAALVTVIIAAYQQPELLNQALESVARQSHPAIEILVVDDASGAEHTKRYRLPPNATLLVHPERRATAAVSRNLALRHAQGAYVTFLDQDDVYLPDKVGAQVALLERQPQAVLTFCHY